MVTYAARRAPSADYTPRDAALRPRGRALRGASSAAQRWATSLLPHVGGAHNVENALGVYRRRARRWGSSFEEIAQGLAPASAGVKRRQEVRGELGGVLVIDDFAHHPTAVRETIAAIRQPLPGAAAVGHLRAALQHQPPQHPPGGVRPRLRRAPRRASIKVPERHDKVPAGRGARRAAAGARRSRPRASQADCATDVRRAGGARGRARRSRATCCW